MSAFIKSLVALAVISGIAAAGLGLVPMSASDVYTESRNVRL
jgi:hypothetical protein